VIKIRKRKLPDLNKIGTAGSFFKNPVVSKKHFKFLRQKYPKLKGFSTKRGIKVHLAYIIDHICGLKGYREGFLGLYKNQPLVIVNYGNASSKDLINFKNKIEKKVYKKTKIEIEPEVRLINF